MKTKDQENAQETTPKFVFSLDTGIISVILIMLIQYHRTIHTQGVSGNGSIVNVGRDDITHISNGSEMNMCDFLSQSMTVCRLYKIRS